MAHAHSSPNGARPMLDGIRVLDLSRVIAGPYCAMLLADLGADVIKLERPGRGDDLRAIRGKAGMSAMFAAINRNKRGIAVEMAHPEGAKIAFELARRADVVIENFLPGAAARAGVGYEAVRAVNPAVVYASVTGFGQTGPYARRPGYNLIAQGMSGLMAITGMPGNPPTRPGGSVADLASAFMAFGAINAALVQRFRTGVGQHLDVNLLASTMALLPDPAALYFDSGIRPGRQGNVNPHVAPAEAFATRDGYLTVVVMSPDHWDRFCQVLGDETLRTSPKFATNDERVANRPEMRARVEAVLASGSTAEWVDRFVKAGIASGPIYEFDQVFGDEQVRHLGLLAEVEQPGLGAVRMLGFPFRTSNGSISVRRPAPRLGEHTAEILAELGTSSAEIQRLASIGAVGITDTPSSPHPS